MISKGQWTITNPRDQRDPRADKISRRYRRLRGYLTAKNAGKIRRMATAGEVKHNTSPKMKHGALIGVSHQRAVWNLIYDANNKAHSFNGGFSFIHLDEELIENWSDPEF